MWILLIIAAYQGVAIKDIVYTSKETCEVALRQVQSLNPPGYTNIKGVCLYR